MTLMIDQIKLFNSLKNSSSVCRYPKEKYPIGESHCRWFSGQICKPWIRTCSQLPRDSIYLELGSFLGMGSTRLALDANPTLRAYCVDHFAMRINKHGKKHKAECSYKENGEPVDYLRGIGTQLEHFLNNTWKRQDRIAPIQQTINAELLHKFADWGIKPDLVMVDDAHEHDPVLERLRAISKLWPEAIVVLDDFVPMWDGVRTGLRAAFKEGLYSRDDATLAGRRLMIIRPNQSRKDT